MELSRLHGRLMAVRDGADSEATRTEIHLLLDQMISSNAETSTPDPREVSALLVHATHLVPWQQEHLLVKVCHLINHLISRLQVPIDDDCLKHLVSYIITAINECRSWLYYELLEVLASIVYNNGFRCQKFLPELVGEFPKDPLFRLGGLSFSDGEVRVKALQCIAHLCARQPAEAAMGEPYREACFIHFLTILRASKLDDTDYITYCKTLQNALKGINAILFTFRPSPTEQMGILLATLKRCMFYGLPGAPQLTADTLYPTALPQYDGIQAPMRPPQLLPSREKAPHMAGKRGGRKTDHVHNDPEGSSMASCTSQAESLSLEEEDTPCQYTARPKESSGDAVSLTPAWRLRTSSESDFSDSESGHQRRLRVQQSRVRQAALCCLLAAFKAAEKRVVYGYWAAFIPDSPFLGGGQTLSLSTVILKDSSNKVRSGALQALSALLEGSRQFLSAAEEAAQGTTAFTSLSASLASSVRELHRTLLLALLAENSVLTLTQIIKCLATLVLNVPYKRLHPGLLSRVWRHMWPFTRHRDVNVRVACLTLLGAVLTAQAPLTEVHLLLTQPVSASPASSGTSTPGALPRGSFDQKNSAPSSPAPKGPPKAEDGEDGRGYSSPLQDGTDSWRNAGLRSRGWDMALKCCPQGCWLVSFCSTLILGREMEGRGLPEPTFSEPLPVRLEALQVLAYLIKGYFPVAHGSLQEVTDIVSLCLGDRNPVVQLHGAKLLEELGTAINIMYRSSLNQSASSIKENASQPLPGVSLQQIVGVWSAMLSGPLPPALQSTQSAALQTSACDVLSTILPDAFPLLPVDRQMVCLTVLLGLSADESLQVKAAAVRALGVFLLFPSLREDVQFVADAASAVLRCMEDSSFLVRTKAAWSLGNLTDTLITNVEMLGDDFLMEVPDMLLLRIIRTAIGAAQDKDKVKSNAVRSLGNLLRFLQPRHVADVRFGAAVAEAVSALSGAVLSDSTMKVRWNACYAVGNAFHNAALLPVSSEWRPIAFKALTSVVRSCKNFKVRIKAALALSCPGSRAWFGSAPEFASVWDALLEALDKSEALRDFSDFRYSESLREQACIALLHLTSLLQLSDTAALQPVLARRSHALEKHFRSGAAHKMIAAAVEGDIPARKSIEPVVTAAGRPNDGQETGDGLDPGTVEQKLVEATLNLQALQQDARVEVEVSVVQQLEDLLH
ncbi:HEAT repeat-containing protein 6 [Lampetra fluviatilis]